MRSRARGWGLVALALLPIVAACGGGSDQADDTTTSTASTTTTLPAMPADFDWWAPAATPLGHGWAVGPCGSRTVPESRGKVLCLANRDGRTAIMEHFRFAAGDGNLNRHAAQFVEDFLADRKAGCGEAYRVDAEPIVQVDAKDGVVKRYGFTGGADAAPDTERTVQWAGVRGPALVILTITGYDPGACLQGKGQGTLEDLRQIIPGLDALVAAAGLPPLTPG